MKSNSKHCKTLDEVIDRIMPYAKNKYTREKIEKLMDSARKEGIDEEVLFGIVRSVASTEKEFDELMEVLIHYNYEVMKQKNFH